MFVLRLIHFISGYKKKDPILMKPEERIWFIHASRDPKAY